MASLGALLRSCLESFKSVLTSQDFGTEYELLCTELSKVATLTVVLAMTSQDFGTEYELLCTELSMQWLRVRLWGESVCYLAYPITDRNLSGIDRSLL